MVDGPGVIVRPPEAVAAYVPAIVLQSAWALNVPSAAEGDGVPALVGGRDDALEAGSRNVMAVSCQVRPTRSAPGGGVGAGVGSAVGAGVGSAVGAAVGGCRRLGGRAGGRRLRRLGGRARVGAGEGEGGRSSAVGLGEGDAVGVSVGARLWLTRSAPAVPGCGRLAGGAEGQRAAIPEGDGQLIVRDRVAGRLAEGMQEEVRVRAVPHATVVDGPTSMVRPPDEVVR